MKKKVYLLAYQRATNYGAVLQIYALKKVIERLGMYVEVVDYLPEFMEYRLKNQPSILSFIKRKMMNFSFKSFFRLLNFTKTTFYDNESLKKHLTDGDFYIVGSDQVWNKNIMKDDPTYFLNFAPHGSKRIGYAISMGNTDLKEPFKSQALPLIKKFDSLSARESFVSNFVKKEFPETKMPIVLDPTLLLNEEDYSDVITKKDFKKEFIIVYSAMHDKRLYELAFHLRKLTGLPIINLGHHFKGANKHEYIKGPGNWLSRIENAKYFITNSFHGTVFAILKKGTFFVVPNEDASQVGLNSRFIELLNSLDLNERLVSNELDLEMILDKEIDYEKSFKLLDKRREESYDYIKTALGLDNN